MVRRRGLVHRVEYLKRSVHRDGRGGDGGNGEVTIGNGWRNALGQLDMADMHAIADIHAGDIGHQALGNGFNRAHQFDLMAHHVDHAAALQAFAFFLALAPDRNENGDLRAFDES